jgi:hypothetical protein
MVESRAWLGAQAMAVCSQTHLKDRIGEEKVLQAIPILLKNRSSICRVVARNELDLS